MGAKVSSTSSGVLSEAGRTAPSSGVGPRSPSSTACGARRGKRDQDSPSQRAMNEISRRTALLDQQPAPGFHSSATAAPLLGVVGERLPLPGRQPSASHAGALAAHVTAGRRRGSVEDGRAGSALSLQHHFLSRRLGPTRSAPRLRRPEAGNALLHMPVGDPRRAELRPHHDQVRRLGQRRSATRAAREQCAHARCPDCPARRRSRIAPPRRRARTSACSRAPLPMTTNLVMPPRIESRAWGHHLNGVPSMSEVRTPCNTIAGPRCGRDHLVVPHDPPAASMAVTPARAASSTRPERARTRPSPTTSACFVGRRAGAAIRPTGVDAVGWPIPIRRSRPAGGQWHRLGRASPRSRQRQRLSSSGVGARRVTPSSREIGFRQKLGWKSSPRICAPPAPRPRLAALPEQSVEAPATSFPRA